MDNSPLTRWNFNADSTVLLLKLSGTLVHTLLKEERNKASMLTHTGISEDISLPKQKQLITSQRQSIFLSWAVWKRLVIPQNYHVLELNTRRKVKKNKSKPLIKPFICSTSSYVFLFKIFLSQISQKAMHTITITFVIMT